MKTVLAWLSVFLLGLALAYYVGSEVWHGDDHHDDHV